LELLCPVGSYAKAQLNQYLSRFEEVLEADVLTMR